MKLLTLITIAATATAVTLAPAAAKSKKHRAYHHHYSQVQPGFAGGYYGEPYAGGYRGYGAGGWYGPGWNSRAVSDPSLGHPSAAEVSRYTGRCVEDLGYGRYEYCGW